MSVIWPFSQSPNQIIPRTINYDLIIQESYPGVCFLSTLMSTGLYQEIREVGGALWYVTNATYNPNTLQWEQDLPCAAGSIAVAFSQGNDGTYRNWIAQPTGLAGVEVVWEQVNEISALGNVTITPLPATGVVPPGLAINPTWSAGGSLETAFEINVTDNSSNIDSALETFSVNGTPVWEVRKDGTLVIGHVPVSALTGGFIGTLEAGVGISIQPLTAPYVADGYEIGLSHGDYVDIPNNQTITGTKEIATGVSLRFGPAGDGTAADTGNTVAIAYGSKFQSAGVFKAENTHAAIMQISDNSIAFYADAGLIVGNTYTPTLQAVIDAAGDLTLQGNANVGGDVSVTGQLGVTGQTTLVKTDITGLLTLAPTAVKSLETYFVGAGNSYVTLASGLIQVNTSKLALLGSGYSGTGATGLTSSDKSIKIVKNAATQSADFTTTGGGIGSVIAKGGTYTAVQINAGATLTVGPLGAGTWFVESQIAGVGLTNNDNTRTLTLSLDGNIYETNGASYQRDLYVCETITSTGSTTPSATATGVNAQTVNGIYFSVKAIRIA